MLQIWNDGALKRATEDRERRMQCIEKRCLFLPAWQCQ